VRTRGDLSLLGDAVELLLRVRVLHRRAQRRPVEVDEHHAAIGGLGNLIARPLIVPVEVDRLAVDRDHTGDRRLRQRPVRAAGQKQANQLIAATPARAGFASLKSWRLLQRLRMSPARATKLLRACSC